MAISHPAPTQSTVKYLYAHAFSCAFEGCNRPLYTVDAETGRRTLASRIAHICARSEGGPRWDPLQTAEKNRDESNLVLMCTEHAAAIDDPSLVTVYSPERLRELKRSQLERFDQIRQGWILTDKMAGTVMEKSFPSIVQDFGQGNIFHLGGQGGLGPGAGGGGGGAIGQNARGGKGGDGGSLKVDDTEYTLPISDFPSYDWKQPKWDPDLAGPTPPGAGGGGGGAVGDNAVAGDGGNGGDRVVGRYDLEAMRRDGFCGKVGVIVGQGGKPTLPNQLPNAGEDTILRFLKDDGSVLKEVRADGGMSATPRLATYLEGWNEPDGDNLRKTRFRVTSLMMASAAEVHSGNFYILGGDWRFYDIPGFPCDTIFSVVVSCRFDGLVSELPTVVFLSLFDPASRETSRAPLVIDPAQCIHGMASFIVPLGATLDLAGDWQVRVWSGSQVLSFLDVRVRDQSVAH